MDLSPVTLAGRHVRLVPLAPEHVPALWAVADDDDIWRWTLNHPRGEDDIRRYVDEALEARARGIALPFATTEADSGRVIGSTRFHNIEPAHRRVEIGYTWIGRPWQRTPVNTEAKYLMLRHAFETWTCVRVEMRTNALNQRSRNAILRIGAKEEGILRRHMVNDAGVFRDTVYYSILDDEWPGVKERLEARLARPWTPSGT